MKKKNNGNSIINFIKELTKTPRGRGILFFVAYFFFFLGVILLVRFSERGEVIGTGYDKSNSYQFSISNIASNNYNFNYEVLIDNNTISYQGKRYEDKELFSLNSGGVSTQYYSNDDNYLINNNGLWIKSDNPYKYSEFFDINNISNIIDKATYISKTNYESGKETYNFQVATSTLNEVFGESIVDIEEIPNEIVLSTDENKYTNEIIFRLDSYCKYKNICQSSMKITLSYSDYGDIEEIDSPVE